MLEKLSKRLVPYGRAHPRLRWPILGLLMLVWCLDGAWAFVRALGRELRKVGREATAHLRETGLTSQGIHDNAQWLLDAGIRGAKKLPGLWKQGRQVILPLVYTKGRAVKVAAPVYYAQVKTLVKRAGCGVAGFARRAADQLRAEAPQYKRHAPRRAMAAALVLVLCLGMLPVSAFAAERQSACPHDLGQHDETCGFIAAAEGTPCAHTEHAGCGYVEAVPETPCTCAAVADEDGNTVHQDGCGYIPATEGTACKHAQGEHDEPCGYVEAVASSPCIHRHDENCGGLPAPEPAPEEAACTCGAVADEAGNIVHLDGCAYEDEPSQAPIALQTLGTASNVIVESRTIYAGGTPLVIAGTSDTSTTIYIDANGDGKADGDQSLKTAGVANAPADNSDLSGYRVYGGSKSTDITGDTKITMTGGKVDDIYGGSPFDTVSGDTYVTVIGGTIKDIIYGGGYYGTVEGNTSVIFGGTATMDSAGDNAIYGGGEEGNVTGNTKVTITGGKVKSVYGGAKGAMGANGDSFTPVSGNAEVLIEGGTVDNVFGSGFAGTITGSATVTMTGGSVIKGLYGGGEYNTKVGSIEVIVEGGTVYGRVYGGSASKRGEVGSIAVVIRGGTVEGDVYAGNNIGTVLGSTLTIGGSAKVGTTTGPFPTGVAINGGGLTAGVDSFAIDPDLTKDAVVNVRLPSNYLSGTICTGAVEADIARLNLVSYSELPCLGIYLDNTEIKIKERIPVTSISLSETNLQLPLGRLTPHTLKASIQPENATNQAVTWTSNNTAAVTVDSNGTLTPVGIGYATITATAKDNQKTAKCYVEVTVPVTAQDNCLFANGSPLLITAGTTKDRSNVYIDLNNDGALDKGDYLVYKDLNLAYYEIFGGSNAASDSTTDAKITMLGGKVKNLFGGGQNGPVSGNTTVTIQGGTAENVYGGGRSGPVSGNTTVTITGGTMKNAFGGGAYGAVSGNTTVTMGGGTVSSRIYGGGSSGNVGGSTMLTMTDGSVFRIYGGGSNGEVTGSTTVNIQGGTMDCVYGAGEIGSVLGSATVTIDAGSIKKAVYGGGWRSDSAVGSTIVNINGGNFTNLYGGGESGCVTGSTRVTLNGGSVGYIYGGGLAGPVLGDTAIVVGGTAEAGYRVYGGGEEGNVNGNTSVTITSGNSEAYIYGGGDESQVLGSTATHIGGTAVVGQLCGGGGADGATVGKGATLTIDGTAEVLYYVYGSEFEDATAHAALTVGGSAKIGATIFAGGIVIKGEDATHGVDSFAIAPQLTDDAMIQVNLPDDFTTGTIATGAVESDLAKIKVSGGAVMGKEVYFDSTDNTIKLRGLEGDIPVVSVTLNKWDLTLEAGKSEALTAKLFPNNATNKTVTWSSSDASVATVVGGVVTGVSAGTATITVTANRSTDTCTVTVTPAIIPPQGGMVLVPLVQENLDVVFGVGNAGIRDNWTVYLKNDINALDTITFSADVAIMELRGHTITGPEGKPAIASLGARNRLMVGGPGGVIGGVGIAPNGDGAPAIKSESVLENGLYISDGAKVSGGAGRAGGSAVVYSSFGTSFLGIDLRSENDAGNGGAGISASGGVQIEGSSIAGGAGGNASGTGSGGAGGSGVEISGNLTVAAGSSVAGGSGGTGVTGGVGGDGVNSSGSGTITVEEGCSANGGQGGLGIVGGGVGGSGTQAENANIIINGTVNGGKGGPSTSGTGGAGGSGTKGSGTITGSGKVGGGTGGDVIGGGGQPGSGGTAVSGGTVNGPETVEGKKGISATATVDNIQNDSGATITVPTEDMVEAAITDAERADDSIAKIDVALNILNKTAEKPNAGAVSSALAGTGATEVGVYLDITLEKSVTKITGDSVKTLVTDAVKPLTITITIPVSMRGGSNFTVIRVHGDDVTALPTHYDPVNHTLTISSDKFSTYAIAYTPETPVTPPTPPYDGGSDSSSTSSAPAPVVTKPDGGTVTLNPTNPRPGQTVTVTPKPDEGYMVEQITVTDKDGKNVLVMENSDGTYSFTQPKTGVTVTVTFKPVEVHLPWNPFTDVAESDWFYESVKYVYEKGLMNGTSGTTFSPYTTISRGMVVTILWRLEGEPTAKGADPFADVSTDTHYAKAVAWAAENGIVKGYSDGNFGPNDLITREQMAAILYRYAQFKGMDISEKGDLSQFTDPPSTWAADAMQWAVGSGIIAGRGNGTLDATGNATRAEAATMLMRFSS